MPLIDFNEVQTWSEFRAFANKCFVPFFFLWADYLDRDDLYTTSPWGWPATRLQDPTIMRTGYVQLWSTRIDPNKKPLQILGLSANTTFGGVSLLPYRERRGALAGVDRSVDFQATGLSCAPLAPL